MDILQRLTLGGYSMVVDISKQFYNFPTAPEDRPYLGLIHPTTEVHLWYTELPMGGKSSPGISGRPMAGAMRKIEERAIFQRKVCINLVTQNLTGDKYDPMLPEGQFLVCNDGKVAPAN
eukprot:15334122-Ditylum_brightwellii.AAC.1